VNPPQPRDLVLGGQAVIEGVMMKGPLAYAVAVRKANGEIRVRDFLLVESAARKRIGRASGAVAWASVNSRAARSMGSVRSTATTLGVKREKARAVWPPPVAMSSTRTAPRC